MFLYGVICSGEIVQGELFEEEDQVSDLVFLVRVEDLLFELKVRQQLL